MRCWPNRCLLSLALIAALLGLALVGPALAQAASSPPSKPGGVVRRTAATGGPFASPIGPSTAGQASPSNTALNPELQLLYHGGPVMHTHTIHLIFWAPPTFSFPVGYEAGVQAFLQDVAADSGKTSNAYGAITQYGDGGGAAQYNVTYGGSVTVNDALPPRDFSSCFDGTTCITDDQLAAEVEAVRAAHSSPAWPRGLADQYVILTPPDVTTCFGDGSGACSDNWYCAYHFFRPLVSAPPSPLIYLHIPYEQADFCHNDFVNTQPMPNGQSDVASDLISHEEREAATDPLLNAWFDDAGNEADDKCIDSYGVIIGVNGSSIGFNQAIGAGQYDTQTEWSNALRGCYQMGKPTISGISPGSAPGGSTVGITGTNFFAAYPSVPTVLFNGHPSPSVTVDSAAHLTVTVPSGSATGKVTVQAVGGNVVSTQTFGLLPTISSLSAASGFAGQSITVTGTGFFGVTSVKFNGAAGAFSTVAADGTSLHVVVPNAATTGTVTVTTAGGTGASSTTFTVLPHVTSFTPAAAVAGANVTIAGTGFSGVPTVDFTGSAGAFLVSHTATSLVVHVPVDAVNGPLTVTTADGSSASVAVFKPLLKISGFDAAAYQAGDVVTVSGSNLLATGVDPTAKLGLLAVTPGSVTATSFQFTVPDNGLTAVVSATNANGTANSPATLKVRPTISGDPAPNEGKAGDHIVLSGKTFTGTTSVKFNGTVVAPFTVGIGGTSLNVTVPSAAVDGPIAVTNAGGTTSTANPFKVDPKLVSFAPLAAAGGANVTISGTGFGASPVVHFTGSPGAATLGVHTATSIVAVVPTDARNGPITVTTANGDATSVAVFKPLLKITGFGAATYQAGDTVTVNGSNFLATGVDPTAKLGLLAVTPGSVTDTSFQFTIPDNGLTAAVSATNANGTANSPATLKVRPTISGDPAPNEAKAGDHIILSGKTFTGTTSVKLNGTVVAPFTVGIGGTSLNVTVPSAAVDGPIAVTNAGGTTSTANPFKVDPKLVSFAPLAAAGGSNVTISGTGFGASPVVHFTGSAAPATLGVHTATSIVAVVPSDARNGPITVTTANGDAVSVAVFKALMKITGFGAANYQAGDTVTVNGSNFLGAGVNPTAKLGASSVSPGSVTDTSFQFTVPDNGLTATVSATNANGTANSPSTLKVRPTISGDPAPNEGKAGDHIVLSGKTFTGTTSVKFNGTVVAPFTVGVGGTSLNVTVPSAAVDGPIAVTNAGGTTSTANPFKVDPKLVSFAPLAAAGGANVTISGTGFGASPVVHFTGSPGAATLGVHTATSIVAVVPTDARNGTITVTTANGDAVSLASFKALMKITGFDAANYLAGDTVTVNGSNFLGAGVNPTVKLGTLAVTPGSVTDTSFQFTVPDNGLTATVSATNANGTANSPTTLKVRPTITGDPAPNEAKAGDHIVLTGKTFTGTTSVKFGNNTQAAAFTIGVGGTTLNVTVPNNATIGKIGVTNAGGLTQTANDFTIDPRINSLSALSGAVGFLLTVNGTGLAGADRVNFAGGVFGIPTNVTATSLKVAVPAGATTGPITVHTPAGTSAPSASSFTVTFSVTSISPTSAVYSHDVTITGVGLTGVTAVKFNGVLGAITSNSGTVIHVTTPPSGAISGTVTVWKGTASIPAPQQFSLLDITSFLPTTATPGADVVITGHGFTGATSVKFHGHDATFTVDSATQITAGVPADADTGTLSVTGPGGTATSSDSFTVSDVTGVLINEFSLGTTAASDDDFVELYNSSSGNVDLSSCQLSYKHGTDTEVVLFPTSPTPVIVQPNHFYVVEPTADLDATDGGLKLTCGAAPNDAVGWGAAPTGFYSGTATAAPAADGSAARMPDGTNSHDNSADFTFDATPTPGATNVP
jgi:IPT/TIG domain